MGARGPKATRYYMLPCGAEFAELVVGPIDASASHVRLMRYRWQNGGESAVQEHYREAGRRPWAWWRFTCPLRERRKALGFRTEAEAILGLGLADEEEQNAIRSGGIIEQQMREAEDRRY
jgi:hypothetical protein